MYTISIDFKSPLTGRYVCAEFPVYDDIEIDPLEIYERALMSGMHPMDACACSRAYAEDYYPEWLY